MSFDNQDISPAKTINIELDGEIYHFHISSRHDEQFLHRASKKVNALIKQLRQQIPRLSYPMLFILVCFKLLEQMEKSRGVNPSVENVSPKSRHESKLPDESSDFSHLPENNENSVKNENNAENDTKNDVDFSFLKEKLSQQLTRLEKILDGESSGG